MYTAVSPRGKLPWWEGHGLSVASLEEDINRHESLWNSTVTGREYMKTFKEFMAISFVFTSNEQEGTLPLGFEAFQTHNFLKDLIDGKPVMYATDGTWLADGKIKDPKAKGGKKDGRGNGGGRAAAKAIGSEAFNAGRRQLLQHMEALLYLCDSCEPASQPLTVAMLQQTHKRLMSGAVTENNEQVNAGEFRTTGACCPGTNHHYLDAQFIAASTKHFLGQYNAAVERGDPVIQRAAQLFFSITHQIHPFKDGNGRLGRMLVAYALKAGGVPFCLPLVDGHLSARKHYNWVVTKYSRVPGIERLQCHILECLQHKWTNFASNLQVHACGLSGKTC